MKNIWIYKKKWAHFLIILGFILATFVIVPNSSSIPAKIYYYFYPRESISCYRTTRESLPEISDLTPVKGNAIFFHETSCDSYYNNKITITARQACAVESAAKMNPDMEVYLLFTSPGKFNFQRDQSDRLLQALLRYDNIRIKHLNFEKYIKDTPLEALYENGLIESSDFARSHASDVLR